MLLSFHFSDFNTIQQQFAGMVVARKQLVPGKGQVLSSALPRDRIGGIYC
jgi:hypothetical protein